VRLEGHENARHFERLCSAYEPLDYVPVTSMNAIEGPDGDNRRTNVRRKPGFVEIDALRHRRQPAATSPAPNPWTEYRAWRHRRRRNDQRASDAAPPGVRRTM